MINLPLRCIIIFTLFVSKTIGLVKLEIDHRDLFPYPANKNFSIFIITRDQPGLKNLNVFDTMVISIVQPNQGSPHLDRAIFDYGFKDLIDQPYRSNYMIIPYWAKETKSNTINVTVEFTRQANGQMLEIHQIVAQTTDERRNLLNNLKETILLLREQVSLLVPPRIELTVSSPDGRKNELKPREIGTATCRSFDGIPPAEPIFYGLDDLDIKKNTFSAEKNERNIQFLVRIFDHEKRLKCRAKETETTSVILVLHHPTQITLDPEPGPLFENGSSIVCLKADGHPSPNIRWTIVSGPINASSYYKLSDDKTKFHLSKDAPLQSRWTLNCSASNVIPGSTAVYNRTVIFIVGRSQEGLLDRYNLTSQIIIGVVVVVVIVLFCLMSVVIICTVRRCCVGSAPPNVGRKTGASNKTSSKEKGLDSEHVILLPPGAPPNYVDLSNSGAGLPPPPPEYELMLNDDTKRASQQETRMDDEGEVTYAELNTSHLPMKSSGVSATAACANNDQVIYSQIVGTVLTPYGTQRSHADTDTV